MISSIKASFFDTAEKLDRTGYWWRTITIVALFIVTMNVLPYLANFLFFALNISPPLWKPAFSVQIGKTNITQLWEFIVFTLPLTILLVLSVLSISVRRLRDRERPVWLVIPMIVVPVLLHLGHWVFNLYHPFSVSSSIGISIPPGNWLYSPEYVFPRALTPLWSLAELDGVRFYNVYKQAMLEINTWPSYFSPEGMKRLGLQSVWHVYLFFLIPAAGLSAWATVELGLLKGKLS
ncbi:DUF805 domain-containing protein [Affinibrenneria salicis]|uniref:DUF805 domain-containing protein n=1 Tax=Affinibrenneria salicis TaxID=2590031 RepID=A0A5J5FT12_9GAMM|nr:DUF805 domain-containing protein [Affinibrenneria salicis]KAA8996622.1 DUF805 domain-containing protein [Affinibrenneria salicis]